MASQDENDISYAGVMSNHPYGIALYRPQKQTVFSPGSCGYFDGFGNWNLIVRLDDASEVKKKGLAPMETELERAPLQDDIRWGPMVSATGKAIAVEMSAGLPPIPGLPVTASTIFKYTSELNTGAVLLTDPPITHERFYHQAPFKNWVKKNSSDILKKWPEVKTYGLWVVTSTFATQRCAINLWKKKGNGLHVGFSADVAGMGEIGPEGEWYRSQTDEGWVEYGGKGEDKAIVFFGGIKFKYTWLMNKHLKPVPLKPAKRKPSQRRPRPKAHWSSVTDAVKREALGIVDDLDDEDAGFAVDCEEYLDRVEIDELFSC